MRDIFSEEDIIKGIKSHDKRIINYLYQKYYIKIKNYVVSNSGTISESEDILQDSIIIIFRRLRKKGFKLTGSFDAYFTNVYRNIWKCHTKQKKQHILLDYFPEDSVLYDNEILKMYEQEQLHKIIADKFKVLEKDCQQVLKMFYIFNRSMKEIAFSLEYKNEQIAKNKRYRCLGYLKTLVKSQMTNEIFHENE
ncbi:MAG: hypothetical protein CVU05_06945 [Bacteroidetes bacterium HGW-Bacteroidetes-21]|jgi:RNA polymerase sigma factor (sigma-70 family)|nr:MAG: hypothetical protein CVU05_06945 [Bacteroidetes bacterium HGW-Bacteroidetes-21]